MVYAFFYALIACLIATLVWFKPINNFLSKLPVYILSAYPDELVITTSGGKVSTNVEEPYFIPVSVLNPIIEDMKKNVLGSSTENIQNILVIDTQAAIEDYYNYKTVVLLTGDHVVYFNNNKLESFPLSEVGPITIEKNTIKSMIEVIRPYLKIASPVFGLVMFVIFYIYISNILFFALFWALLLLIPKTLMGVSFGYKKLYQMTVHLALIPATIFPLLNFAGINLSFPFRDTLIVFVLGTFILYKIKHLFPPQTTSKTTPQTSSQR